MLSRIIRRQSYLRLRLVQFRSLNADGSDYSRLKPREHVLLRPGMYIGQVDPSMTETWLLNESRGVIEKRPVLYSNGLIKLFDEILVNAADNRRRDASMSTIDIEVNSSSDPERPEISVRNDGRGIPVVMHEEEEMYVP
jgi:DNA topoisomerase II